MPSVDCRSGASCQKLALASAASTSTYVYSETDYYQGSKKRRNSPHYANYPVGSIAFQRSLHAAEVALQESAFLNPKLQNAAAIVVPGEEGIIAVKLK